MPIRYIFRTRSCYIILKSVKRSKIASARKKNDWFCREVFGFAVRVLVTRDHALFSFRFVNNIPAGFGFVVRCILFLQ